MGQARLSCQSDDREKLATSLTVIAESALHTAGKHRHARGVDPSSGHALMRGFDDNGHTERLKHFTQGVSNLYGQLLLDLQPLGIDLNQTRELRDTYYSTIRQISHMGL